MTGADSAASYIDLGRALVIVRSQRPRPHRPGSELPESCPYMDMWEVLGEGGRGCDVQGWGCNEGVGCDVQGAGWGAPSRSLMYMNSPTSHHAVGRGDGGVMMVPAKLVQDPMSSPNPAMKSRSPCLLLCKGGIL